MNLNLVVIIKLSTKMVLFDIIHSHKQFCCQLTDMVKESKTGDTDEKPKVAPYIRHHV